MRDKDAIMREKRTAEGIGGQGIHTTGIEPAADFFAVVLTACGAEENDSAESLQRYQLVRD